MCEESYFKIDERGNKFWYKNGTLPGQIIHHRTDGPAVEWNDGSKEWWLDGLLHRINEPAIEYTNGDKEWYYHGVYHRLDGPAVKLANGEKRWYINDKQYSEEEYWRLIKLKVFI